MKKRSHWQRYGPLFNAFKAKPDHIHKYTCKNAGILVAVL